MKLSKADKEWLKHEWFASFVLLDCILPHDLFHCSSEFNSEYKLDSAYSRVPMSEVKMMKWGSWRTCQMMMKMRSKH